MRISDWSSDVCSSDLDQELKSGPPATASRMAGLDRRHARPRPRGYPLQCCPRLARCRRHGGEHHQRPYGQVSRPAFAALDEAGRSEEHTSELQSLMRISYAVFCLKKKKKNMKNRT